MPRITIDVADPTEAGSSFQDLCDDHEIRLRTDYSGRGMMNQTCLAITGEPRDLMRFALFVLPEFYGNPDKVPTEWESLSTDSMGLGAVYYWRNIAAA